MPKWNKAWGKRPWGKPSLARRIMEQGGPDRSHPVFDTHPGDREPDPEDGRKPHPHGKERPPVEPEPDDNEEETPENPETPEPPEVPET